MPSLPNRLLQAAPTLNPSPSTEAGSSPYVKSERDVDLPMLESSPAHVSQYRTLRQSPRHGRSHSHPLNTLLALRRRNVDSHHNVGDPMDTDLVSSAFTSPNINPKSSEFPNGDKSKTQDKKLVSGRYVRFVLWLTTYDRRRSGCGESRRDEILKTL